ncbi:MAG: tyrosine-type recombinase/integrase [Cyclobacteriaceae bacterium]|nr:tyrosine-type recombinase/integrase [Cyclobacteriaceae bacterium]MDH4296819.1 tyrosine-type recombinase/integrase [Cyclobacteriaceae bacterium]MDH5247449.1 tyrosine-type recombinase/integrase [Cyclobacteriaceae bacterium]
MIESFLKYLQFEKRLSLNTLRAYRNDLDQFSDFLGTNHPEHKTEEADYGIIRAWIIHLVECGIEPLSVNRKIACLRTFFKFLLKQDVIPKDPMVKIGILKTRKKLPSFVKESDMVNLLDGENFNEDTLEGMRDKLILELFYATGIRLSELITLKENQVDLRNRTIKVLGKRNKERVIPFPKSIVKLVEEYTTTRNKALTLKGHGYLFVTSKGERCYPMLVYRTVKKYLNLHTTADKISPHVLRHTYATHLLNKGAEINAVKDLLGHSSLAATQIYTHNSMDKLKRIFEQAHPKA